MKKFLIASALTLASTASADQVGAFLFGVQYQQDNGLRYGLGLPAVGLFDGGGLFVNGDVSYLIPFAGVNRADVIAPYFGFGLGIGVGVGSGAAGLGLYPNVLVGVDFRTGTPFTPFAELSAGPVLGFAAGGGGAALGVGLGYDVRLGFNYRLN